MADNNNSLVQGKSVEVSKKSFEYKISKKVAELIQVVHMLFTKNHEREIELQATKDAYEDEIANVIGDAQNRLKKLQQSFDDEKRRSEVHLKKVELEARGKEEQYELKLSEAYKTINENDDRVAVLKKQNENLLEELKEKHSEYEALKKLNEHLSSELQQQKAEHGRQEAKVANDSQAKDLTAALADCRAELRRREAELNNLHAQLNVDVSTQKTQYENMIDKLKTDYNHSKGNLQQQLLEIRKQNEKLEQKNKNLEVFLKRMKDNERRSSSTSVSSATEQKQVPTDSSSPVPYHQVNNKSMILSQDGSYVDPREEVERLRREIQWYRMELTNRESNFNRMFTDTSPIRLAGRVGKLAVTRSKTEMSMRMSGDRKHQSGSPTQNNNHLRRRGGHHERLPALSMDLKQRTSTRMETFDHRL